MTWFDTLLRQNTTMPFLVFGLLAAAFAGLMLSVVSWRESERKRAQSQRLERVRTPAKRVDRRSGRNTQIVKRDRSVSRFGALNKLMRKLLPNVGKLRIRLQQTGRNITLDQYLLASLATGIVATVIALFSPFPIVADLLFGLICGVALPYFAIGFMAKRRLNRFVALFPDAIDLIVRAVRSGQPVTEAIKNVAEQAPQPVGGEFREMRDSIKLGMTLPEALTVAADRLDLLEFRFFTIALNVQQETGGNLSETLENLSRMLRRRRQIKMKVKAASAEARASAWIVGSLPFIMFFVIMGLNREYAMMLVLDPRGIMMSMIGLGMSVTGIIVMAKMANFEV
ncbi:MAG: tight adherence protein [Rhodospirillaceae bacterium]|jgi:tight adherence protein B|nr:tight adherence protein [Rhodospirillaceae bacterium]